MMKTMQTVVEAIELPQGELIKLKQFLTNKFYSNEKGISYFISTGIYWM